MVFSAGVIVQLNPIRGFQSSAGGTNLVPDFRWRRFREETGVAAGGTCTEASRETYLSRIVRPASAVFLQTAFHARHR
jgi:hypothetical protein